MAVRVEMVRIGAGLLLASVLLVLCCLPTAEAARGGGGARFSSSRYSSYRSSYGSYRGSSSGFVRSRFSRTLQVYALTRGLFFYRHRTRYSRGSNDLWGNSEPSLCLNVKDPLSPELNASVVEPWLYRNETVLGIFVCPLDDNDGKVFCCGEDDAEYCCTYWDNPGRVAGVVVAIIVVLTFLGYMAFKLSRRLMCGGGGGGMKSPEAAYAADMSVAYKQ